MEFTKEQLFQMIEESTLNFNVEFAALDPDELLTKQGLDSLDMASLLFEIESYCGFSISDESITNGEWRTINKIVSSVNKLKIS